jgi:leucyl-tRNA synthetase
MGYKQSLAHEPWPAVNPEYLKVDIIEYPVSFNGKMRFKIELPADMGREEIEKAVLEDARSEKWTGGT